MAQAIHSVAELRNRFFYDADTGELRWRRVDFPTWSRGKLSPSRARYENWLRDFGGQPVTVKLLGGVPAVYHRKRPYMVPRLLWALSTGEHPPEGAYVLLKNGDQSDFRASNLDLVAAGGLIRARAQRRRGGGVRSRAHIPDIVVLETWLRYAEGDLCYRAVPWADFSRRYRRASREDHETWLLSEADKPLPQVRSRRAPLKVLFGTRPLPKAELVFAVCRGFVLPDGVELAYIDGDWRNCRIENLRVDYPEGFGNEDDD